MIGLLICKGLRYLAVGMWNDASGVQGVYLSFYEYISFYCGDGVWGPGEVCFVSLSLTLSLSVSLSVSVSLLTFFEMNSLLLIN
jgi:hypothetical protein